ncbi:MAG: 2-amino-4-hydroxy-6-hydroxymethyldihydropteridine diphosphokinase [Candidatus Omnitrophica bacterium]|nr:2-amino-4-hydroxy-6-hydroxymethyldihydropteridine diphosphokinase [Candidatus Omnitrophota bacterium]
METCYIGIGSNLGDRRQNIDRAIEELKAVKGIKFKRSSSIYETEPVSDIPQGKFLNGVLEIEAGITPRELLTELNKIEKKLGRKRTLKNAPREIDLDILYYGQDVIEETGLVVPHPKIPERDFVLRGLKELGRI